MKTIDDLTSEELLLIQRQIACQTKLSLIAKLNGISMKTIRAIRNGGFSRDGSFNRSI